MRIIACIFCLVISISLGILLNQKIGKVPPIGSFFSPFQGYLQNAGPIVKQGYQQQVISTSLISGARIYYDDEGIPHVFASNDYDLYFSQGYVTAKDRLWQMDFQTRFASGRLSEVVGTEAYELDRYQRRMGMVFGAERMLEESFRDPLSRMMLEAYADGVNAYIGQLDPKNYPVEFKILDYKPEKWKPLNSALLLKLMSATLAGGSDELYLQHILDHYGTELTESLFPAFPDNRNPIIPSGTDWPFEALTTPSVPGVRKIADRRSALIDAPSSTGEAEDSWLLTSKKPENIGSNNWAIGGKRSATGYPILANDPHLKMTLPSIWYEIQLKGTDANTMGVSIPGAPGIIIGFNEQVAWGVTNVGSDVLDWYRIEFQDADPGKYYFGGSWRDTESRIEEIRIRNEGTRKDTVYYTHHGPVSYRAGEKPQNFSYTNNIPEGHALRWVAHLPSNDLACFYQLNRATGYEDYRRAIQQFSAPAQNFVFADRHQNIAITPNGWFPLKYAEQGKFLLDGQDPADEWHGRIPADQNPSVLNPPQQFVASANQSPVDKSYPYYLDWQFAPPDRAIRIDEVLKQLSKADYRDLQRLQLDSRSILADSLLPGLIELIGNLEKLTSPRREAIRRLAEWNHHYEQESIAASIFDAWYDALEQSLWSPLFDGHKARMRYPNRDQTVRLLLSEDRRRALGAWMDLEEESWRERVLQALDQSLDRLKTQLGDAPENWSWGNYKATEVAHLADMPGFGSGRLMTGGAPKTVNAVGSRNGPSWRMIVELGEHPKAYGILPGGASGNPGSPYYDNQLERWQKGELRTLFYPDSEELARKNSVSTLELIRP